MGKHRTSTRQARLPLHRQYCSIANRRRLALRAGDTCSQGNRKVKDPDLTFFPLQSWGLMWDNNQGLLNKSIYLQTFTFY
jgi:hypothetical protein